MEDELLIAVGAYGRYQKFLTGIIGFISSLTAMTVYSSVFIANQPKMKCFYFNGTYIESNFTQTENCEIYSKYLNSSLSNQNSNYNCSLDNSYFYGLVNEWELICDKKFLASLVQTIYLVGTICGLFMGFFSDKFGRKKTAVVLSILFTLVLFLSELVQLRAFGLGVNSKFIFYCICQFMLGGLSKGLYLVVYILLIETTIAKYNTIVSNINLYMYVFGELLLLAFAYFFRNWHVMTISIAAYSSIFIFLIAFLLPESPRFLIAKNKKEEAVRVLKRFAKYNNKLNEPISNYLNEQTSILNENDNSNQSLKENQKSSFKDLWKPRINLIKTSLFMYLWLALNLVYYGVSLGITGLDDQINPYLMYLLSSFAEIIGYMMCHLNDKFGRKKTLIFFLVSSSIVCLIVAAIPASDKGTLGANAISKIIFASLGKSMASAAFNSAYIYNSLLYPTAIRSTAVLFSSNVGGIGSFISPQINLLQTLVWRPFPYIIFSTSSLLAGFFVILLPDPDKERFL